MPLNKPLEWSEAFASPPVEFGMAGLMKAHGTMTAVCPDPRDAFIRTEGTVAEDDVALADVFDQALRAPHIVEMTTGDIAFQAAVAEIYQSDDVHYRKAAARLLGRRLWIDFLVRQRVIELDGGAVEGFYHPAMPEIILAGGVSERSDDSGIDAV